MYDHLIKGVYKAISLCLPDYSWPLPSALCPIWIYLDVLFSTASIMHLCAISLDRYVAIRNPIEHSRFNSRTKAMLKIAAVWTISIGQRNIDMMKLNKMHYFLQQHVKKMSWTVYQSQITSRGIARKTCRKKDKHTILFQCQWRSLDWTFVLTNVNVSPLQSCWIYYWNVFVSHRTPQNGRLCWEGSSRLQLSLRGPSDQQ